MILGGISVFKRFVWNITIAVVLSGLSVFWVGYIYYNSFKWNVSILGGLQCISILHYIYVSIPVVTGRLPLLQ